MFSTNTFLFDLKISICHLTDRDQVSLAFAYPNNLRRSNYQHSSKIPTISNNLQRYQLPTIFKDTNNLQQPSKKQLPTILKMTKEIKMIITGVVMIMRMTIIMVSCFASARDNIRKANFSNSNCNSYTRLC